VWITFWLSGIKKDLSMKPVIRVWRRRLRDEGGLEVVEYAVIVGLVVVAAIIALSILGMWVSGQFSSVSEDVGTDP
jgi:Flp pilus assembly pilin Flp